MGYAYCVTREHSYDYRKTHFKVDVICKFAHIIMHHHKSMREAMHTVHVYECKQKVDALKVDLMAICMHQKI